jgi:hypothetical protein
MKRTASSSNPATPNESRRHRARSVVLATALLALAGATGAVGAASGVHARGAAADPGSQSGSLSGQRVTLVRGQPANLSRIDSGEPNEEFEEGVAGEEAPPIDTPYRPTEPATAVSTRAVSTARGSVAFSLFRSSVAKPNSGGAVAEPTAASGTSDIIATGNTWAALSNDNGLTWPSSLVLNPASSPPTGMNVCCDQVAYSVPRDGHTLFFWLIQNDCGGTRCGGSSPNGENALTLRMFGDESTLLAGNPCDFTLRPSNFGLSSDFFDFNKVSSTNDFLYVVSDIRTLTHKSGGAIVIRYPLDNLDDGDCQTGYRYWIVKDQDSLAPVQDAGSTMFLAAHVNDVIQGDQLRIYKIPDSSNTLTHADENVNNYGPNNRGSGSCPSPDGDDPCKRFNDNQTVGFHSGNSIGWLWTAPQDSSFPFPQVRVAVFDTGSLKTVDEHTIWNNGFAWTYPAVGVNKRGDIGVVLYAMGGGKFPRAQAFLRTDPRDWSGIQMHALVSSVATIGKGNAWGDYASVHRYNACPNTFLGIVWSIQTSGGKSVSENRSVWFGDPADACGDLTVTALAALPAQLHQGDTFAITGITKNLGATIGPTTTRYYFSTDTAKSADDVRVKKAKTAVPELLGGNQFTGTAASAVVPSLKPGTYHLIACANDKKPVADTNPANNCFTGTQTFTITRKKLVATQSPAPHH